MVLKCPHCGIYDYEIFYRPDAKERAVYKNYPEAFKDREWWQCRNCGKNIKLDPKRGVERMKLTNMEAKDYLTVVDLFCGCGGFSEGFRQAGFEILLAVDIWETACKSYEANFPEVEVWQEDITKLKPEDIPEADVLIGGPECKDFSVANTAYIMRGERKKKPDMSQINAFLRIAKSGRFKYWIMENVPPVRKLLPGLRCKILNSADFGVPQGRKRAFFGNFPLPPKHPSKPSEVANTITATLYKGGLTDARRRFFAYLGRRPTIIDVLYYQGFPLNWILFGTKAEKFEQVGNAVPPPVAKALGYAIRLKEGLL